MYTMLPVNPKLLLIEGGKYYRVNAEGKKVFAIGQTKANLFNAIFKILFWVWIYSSAKYYILAARLYMKQINWVSLCSAM
jgi:hypothetical protein